VRYAGTSILGFFVSGGGEMKLSFEDGEMRGNQERAGSEVQNCCEMGWCCCLTLQMV